MVVLSMLKNTIDPTICIMVYAGSKFLKRPFACPLENISVMRFIPGSIRIGMVIFLKYLPPVAISLMKILITF